MQRMEGERRRFARSSDWGVGESFHPRRYRWNDHFVLLGAVIEPLTAEGRATARLLKLNLDRRVIERQLLVAVGRYPR